MVDSIGTSGQTQNATQTSQVKKRGDVSKVSDTSGSTQADTVNISSDALDLVQAQETARATANQLSDDQSVTLTSDPERLNALI